MNTYNFDTINDKDFENLLRDLLQKELGLTLETFKSGKDKGIDLRYSKSKDETHEIVIQAKHWLRTGLTPLLKHLSNSEVPKVRKLKPKRYILGTSVELSHHNKLEIKKLFKPYILNTSDVFGKDDINNLLGKYKEIETKYYKLWLTSSNILGRIINNGVLGRSEFIESQILTKIKLFVQTKSANDATKLLGSNKFIVILGEPGIGKTLLSEFLIYTYLANDYRLIYIDEKISDAEEAFDPDPDSKQIFYFDDFLGSNYLEIMQPKNSDTAILNFIERVRNTRNKYLILTTRTTILNQAKINFEKLESKKLDISKFEIHISDYSDFDKALILYNHMNFSNLPNEYLEKIYDDKNYWKIISHKNYNPRIIEFITDYYNAIEEPPKEYINFILNKLENPNKVYESAYMTQIDEYCRFLLTTLFSLKDRTREEILQTAFEERLSYEIQNNGFKRQSNVFYLRVKQLLGGFINREVLTDGTVYYTFFNPSISDFLIYHLNKFPDEKWRILESSIYFEQLSRRFSVNDGNAVSIQVNEMPRMKDLLKRKFEEVEVLSNGSKLLEFINLYINLFNNSHKDIITEVLDLFKKLNFDEIEYFQFDIFYNVLTHLAKLDETKEAVSERWDDLISSMFFIANKETEFEKIVRLFKTYGLKYSDYMADYNNKQFVQERIDNFWEMNLDWKIDNDNDLNIALTLKEVESVLDSIYSSIINFNSYLMVDESPSFDQLSDLSLEKIVADNTENQYENIPEDWKKGLFFHNEKDDQKDIIQSIDELFSR